MTLFINTGCGTGYDLCVNRTAPSGGKTAVEAVTDNGFEKKGEAQIRFEENRLMLSVPKALPGNCGNTSFTFKWADNYEEGNVIPLAMNANYGSEAFRKKAAAGLTAMADNEGPYLVHCTEGKDRTGFICLLLEALAGASYEEIVSDYMITYDNYYEISTEKYRDKYDVIIDKVLVPMIRIIVDDESVELESVDMTSYAESYLLSGGMEMEAIERLKGIILE